MWYFGLTVVRAEIFPMAAGGRVGGGCVVPAEDATVSEGDRHLIEYAAWIAEARSKGEDPQKASRAEHRQSELIWQDPFSKNRGLRFQEAERIIDANWSAVVAVAEALVACRSLDAEALDAVRREHMNGD